VAGVPLGGLGPRGAERELRKQLGDIYGRAVKIRVGRTTRKLRPRVAGHEIDYEAMLDRAFDLTRRHKTVVQVPLRHSVSRKKLRAAVAAVGRHFYVAPRNARMRYGVTKVVRIRGRVGRALDEKPLRREVLRELGTPTPHRLLKGKLRTVQPQITSDELGSTTFVSIDRGSFTLRLFKGTRLARRYQVAVGAGGYDTPAGLRRVVAKEVNPAWHAPNRPWAGELAGQTIPPGDPRNPLIARFIHLGDGIGIHGTNQEGSIGTRASHGCIRMRVAEVKRLFPLVSVGTPVLIR
jgi:hypothetical protein